MPTQNSIQEDARLIYSGKFVDNLFTRNKLVTKGAIAGAVIGFVFSVMYQKNKFGSTVVGCFVGGLVGFGANNLFEKQ